MTGKHGTPHSWKTEILQHQAIHGIQNRAPKSWPSEKRFRNITVHSWVKKLLRSMYAYFNFGEGLSFEQLSSKINFKATTDFNITSSDSGNSFKQKIWLAFSIYLNQCTFGVPINKFDTYKCFLFCEIICRLLPKENWLFEIINDK